MRIGGLIILAAIGYYAVKLFLRHDKKQKEKEQKRWERKAASHNSINNLTEYYAEKASEKYAEQEKKEHSKKQQALVEAMNKTEKQDNEDSISYLARCMREAEKDNQE